MPLLQGSGESRKRTEQSKGRQGWDRIGGGETGEEAAVASGEGRQWPELGSRQWRMFEMLKW